MGRSWSPVLVIALAAAACGDAGPQSAEAGESAADSPGEAAADSNSDADSQDGSADTASSEGSSEVCGELRFATEGVAPPVTFVLERTAAAQEHRFDHDADPLTPDRSAAAQMSEFVELHMGRYGAPSDGCENMQTGLVIVGGGSDGPVDASTCAWSPLLDPNTTSGGQVTSTLDALAGPSGATPLYEAFVAARDDLLVQHGHDWQQLVLVLDTPPNCADPEAPFPERLEALDPRLLDEVGRTFLEHNISTMVVAPDPDFDDDGSARAGVPDGVLRRDYLNQLALAGGNPQPGEEKFYDAAEALDVEAFAGFGEHPTWEFELNTPPNRALEPGERIEVVWVNGLAFFEFPYDPVACDAGDYGGWSWSEPGERIMLCGAAVDATSCTHAAPFMWGIEIRADILCE